MSDKDRRHFLKAGAGAVLGVGALGALAGCASEPSAAPAPAASGGLALHAGKYDQLMSSPEARREFVAALDEVASGLLADPAAYASFIESTDAVGSLRIWDANADLLADLAGPTDGATKAGRLKRILVVSELHEGATGLDSTYRPGTFGQSDMVSSSSSSSVSSGGDCATNGSATNGCCVIHTWGWSSGDGLC